MVDAVRRDGGGKRPESGANVNVSYEISEDDQLAYNLWLGDTALLRKPLWKAFTGAYSLIALGFGASLVLTGVVRGHLANVLLGLFCLFCGMIALPLPALQRRWRGALIRWNLKRNAAMVQKYRGTRTATVEATGLRVVGSTGERLLLWDGLHRAETATLDIFHVAPADAIVIPRRAFSSDAHRQNFLAAIESAKAGAIPALPTPAQAQTWWTQSGVTEAETQNVQRGG